MPSQSGDSKGEGIIRVQLELNPMIGLQGKKVENGWVELREGTTVKTFLRKMDFDLEKMPIIVIVNGRMANLDTVCLDGDRIAVLPQIAGG